MQSLTTSSHPPHLSDTIHFHTTASLYPDVALASTAPTLLTPAVITAPAADVLLELDLLVELLLTLLYVLVGVSGTGTLGRTPIVICASPPPCCPSIPITM